LHERGIAFPESPLQEDAPLEPFSRLIAPRDNRLSSLTEGSHETWGVPSPREPPMPFRMDEDDTATDYHDATETPRRTSTGTNAGENEDDPLKTPTPFAPKTDDDDGYVMGGEAGLNVLSAGSRH
jgi:hypothetical protein